jgi:hypothetical protein
MTIERLTDTDWWNRGHEAGQADELQRIIRLIRSLRCQECIDGKSPPELYWTYKTNNRQHHDSIMAQYNWEGNHQYCNELSFREIMAALLEGNK